jgi:hypothetical protein
MKTLLVISGLLTNFLVVQSVYASEYGCKVLLCLANPGGPTQYAECVPPICQLWHDLSHGRSFPSCDLSDGNSPGTYAKQVAHPYDPCPAGMSPAPRGTLSVQGTAGPNNWPVATGIPATSEALGDDGRNSGPQACVGKLIGAYPIGEEGATVSVYDKLVWQPYKSPRAIDVYVNDRLQTRVHW